MKVRAREQEGDEKVLLTELEEVEAQVPAQWWASGEVCASAGSAFAELGQLKRAIDYYTRAANAEQSRAPMWAIEQLASCKIRLAGDLATTPEGTAGAQLLLDEAAETLKHLLALSRSSERLALQGALMKRRALLARTDASLRREALQGMSRAYAEAFERSKTTAQPLGTPYPLANQIAAEIVLGWATSNGATLPPLLEMLKKASDAQASSHTDFFSLSALAECALLNALRDPSLDDGARETVQERYFSALSRGITTRQLDSVRTMLNFFSTLIQAEYPDGKLAAVTAQLALLEKALVARA